MDVLRYVILANGKVYFNNKYIVARQSNNPIGEGTGLFDLDGKLKMKTSKEYLDIYKQISEKFEKLLPNLSDNSELSLIKDQIIKNLENEIERYRKEKPHKTFQSRNKILRSLIFSLLRKGGFLINKNNVLDIVNSINQKINK